MRTIRPMLQTVTPELEESIILEDSSRDLIDPTASEQTTPYVEIGSAAAMSDYELACFHATKYVLQSHKYLSEKDIVFASNFITSFYEQSQRRREDTSFTEDQLILFFVYADLSSICKFALLFNAALDNAIINEDTNTIVELILGPKEKFVELYDNPYLKENQRNFITRLLAREIAAFTSAFQALKEKILNFDVIDNTCSQETFSIDATEEENVTHVTLLATRCYEEVCIQDATIRREDAPRALMAKSEKPAENVYTVDKAPGEISPSVYCFNTLDLMNAMMVNPPINPKTSKPFSDYSVHVINQRFSKELALYRRYYEIVNSV